MNIQRGVRTSLVMAILSIATFAVVTRADPLSKVAGAGITTLTAKELIQKADIVVKQAIADANSAGIDIVTNVSESLNIAIANFKNVVDEQSSKVIGDLSKERQAMAFALAKAMNDVKNQSQYLVGFGDMALLSLEHTIDSSILGAFSGKSIVVQKILGRGQLQSSKSKYSLGILATNIGTGASDISNNFELLIDGKKIDYESNGLNRHKRMFSIDNTSMHPNFDPNKVSNAYLTIKVKQTHHGLISWLDKVIEHDINVNLSLFPQKAGELVIQYDLPTYQWEVMGGAEKKSSNHCDNCGGNGRAFNLTLEVPGGDYGGSTPLNSERLVNVKCTCTSGSLCWYDENGPAGAHVVNISPHKNIASCKGYHRTKPTTWVLSAKRQKYVNGTPESKSSDVVFEFNKPQKISVPKSAVSIRLVGTLITGENINIGLDPLSDTTGQVVLSGSDIDGINKHLFLEIKPKSNVDTGIF